MIPASANPLFLSTDVTGYNLSKSLRFRGSANAYLSRTPSIAGNQQKWTFSAWIKRGNLSTSINYRILSSGTISTTEGALTIYNDNLLLYKWNGSGFDFQVQTNAVFRDPSAWYHIVVAYDTTQATSSNRVLIWVNGVQVTSFSAASYPSLNYSGLLINNNSIQNIGFTNGASSSYQFDGYMAEINHIDGQQLSATSFGEFDSITGVWKPKAYTGTYGTNGFYLPFTDVATTSGSNAGLGKDFSGNGNYWTTNNISVTSGTTYDSMTDVPTLTSAAASNYAVINANNTNGTPSNAGLKFTGASATHSIAASSIAFNATENKYCEVYIDSTNTSTNGIALGLVDASKDCNVNGTKLSAFTGGYGWQNYLSNGGFNFGASASYSTYNSSAVYATGDVIGIQLNNGTLTFYKNGTSQGTAASGITGTFCFAGSAYDTDSFSFNFGQRPFAYTPPTGATALNTYNLPDSTIVAGNKYMDATLYTGTGSSLAITNSGAFKPDLVWMKSRSNATSNDLTDSVRGVTKVLYSQATDAETTWSDNLTSFNSNGFTIAANSTFNTINVSPRTYVAWQWQAGQGTTSSNTNGSITSTVSANTSAGFSIVTYTGTGGAKTVGHGLGVTPSLIIVKARGAAANGNWRVYHSNLTSSSYNLILNTTDAQYAISSATGGGVGTPNSTTFSLIVGSSTANYVNESGINYVAYCWSEVAGFSKFGSFGGNGTTDNAFIYTGFRPKFVLIKRTDSTSNWFLLDSTRSQYNLTNSLLRPNLSDAEVTATNMDFVSNGIKLRDAGFGSGETYIYMAFAENPFKNSLAR